MLHSHAVSLTTDVGRFAERNHLTAREQEVLGLLVSGCDSVPRIADALGLSRNTIHNHFKNIFRRTRCNSKTALLARFISSVAARRARPSVAAPRVLLLCPSERYVLPLGENLARLGMLVYAESNPARLLDRVQDLRIHVVVTDASAHRAETLGPLSLLTEMYGDHPAIFHASAPPRVTSGAGRNGNSAARSFHIPEQLDGLAIAIYRHCAASGFGLARQRRVSTSLSVRMDGDRLATVSNLSPGGAFIELPSGPGAPAPPPAGTGIDLQLTLPDGQHLPVRGEVIWARAGAAPGIGVRFRNVAPVSAELLRAAS